MGEYVGSYEATKAEIALAPGVRVQEWKRDDGSTASGTGQLRLSLSADGSVTGSIEPPLGPGLLRGVYSDGLLSATLEPTHPLGEEGFQGTVWGRLEDGALVLSGSAATSDAKLARKLEARLPKRSRSPAPE